MKHYWDQYADFAYAAMRVVLAFLYFCHGLQKLVGALGGHQVPLASLFGIAALIESIAAPLIALGLFTPYAALLASGEMAAAYFIAHAPQGKWPIQNSGELAVSLCFAFLYIATRGGGKWSLDARLQRRVI